MTTSSGAPGVPSGYLRPGTFLKMTFGASPNSAGGRKKILILANKAAAGSATAGTEKVKATTLSAVETAFGKRSELYIAIKAAMKKFPAADINAIAVAEPSGVQASGTLTVTGGATASGTLEIWIHRVRIAVSITAGMSANDQATAIAAAINGAEVCGSASASTNTVVFTYTHKGTRGNACRVRLKATDITGSSYAWGAATLSGGTGDDSLATALTTAGTELFDFYAVATTVTTELQALQSHLLSQGGPLTGKPGQGVACSVASFGTATTQAETLNESLMQILWHRNAEDLTAVTSTVWAALRAVEEADDPSVNLSSFSPDKVDLWDVLGPPAASGDYISDSESAAALEVGLTPVQINEQGHPYVVMSITTHSNDSGGNPDRRTLTTNMVSVPIAWYRAVSVHVPTTFPNMRLAADPQEGDDPLPPRTVTPRVIKASLQALYTRQFVQKGHVTQAESDMESWAFNVASGNNQRCNATMGMTPTPWFTQFSGEILQLTAGS